MRLVCLAVSSKSSIKSLTNHQMTLSPSALASPGLAPSTGFLLSIHFILAFSIFAHVPLPPLQPTSIFSCEHAGRTRRWAAHPLASGDHPCIVGRIFKGRHQISGQPRGGASSKAGPDVLHFPLTILDCWSGKPGSWREPEPRCGAVQSTGTRAEHKQPAILSASAGSGKGKFEQVTEVCSRGGRENREKGQNRRDTLGSVWRGRRVGTPPSSTLPHTFQFLMASCLAAGPWPCVLYHLLRARYTQVSKVHVVTTA